MPALCLSLSLASVRVVVSAPSTPSFLLLEDGASFFLLEDGSKLIL